MRFPEGSEESEALRDLSQKDEEHWQRPFPEIADELRMVAARSTLEQVLHSQHNIFRRKPAHKQGLSPKQIEARLAFAHMALQITVNAIVFTDEMWVEFNKPRCRRNVSRYRGVNSNEYAIHNSESQPIRIMFWGAIILDGHLPFHIWEQDTSEDKVYFQRIVDGENEARMVQQEFDQQQAVLPGTWQYEELMDFNNGIDQINMEEGRTGRHKRRRKTPDTFFHEARLKFTSKGGINWVSYRERILPPKLYPWCNKPAFLEVLVTGNDYRDYHRLST